ncbi:SPW repeat domain-containing protein [Roseivirga seohaensis]|uniref:SPW repeat domain-containing protein n=1 Tax=Roseivirga seohaensis TaxID=1914963 RepID=UPI003BA88DFA
MRFVTKNMHAFLDYPVALALIGLPFILGLGNSNSFALLLSVATGIAAFILTLLTDHRLGVYRIVPYKWHLIVDALVGLVFITAPFLFSFSGIDANYFWINGAAVLTVVSLHKPEQASEID